jgi:hypothetical protein
MLTRKFLPFKVISKPTLQEAQIEFRKFSQKCLTNVKHGSLCQPQHLYVIMSYIALAHTFNVLQRKVILTLRRD